MSLPRPDRLSTIGPDDPVNITAEPAAVTTSRDKATAPFRWRAPHRAAPWHRYPHLCARSARFPTGLDLPAWIAPEMQRPGPPLPLLVRGILALYKKRIVFIKVNRPRRRYAGTGRCRRSRRDTRSTQMRPNTLLRATTPGHDLLHRNEYAQLRCSLKLPPLPATYRIPSIGFSMPSCKTLLPTASVTCP